MISLSSRCVISSRIIDILIDGTVKKVIIISEMIFVYKLIFIHDGAILTISNDNIVRETDNLKHFTWFRVRCIQDQNGKILPDIDFIENLFATKESKIVKKETKTAVIWCSPYNK